jgi:hypothetical protein
MATLSIDRVRPRRPINTKTLNDCSYCVGALTIAPGFYKRCIKPGINFGSDLTKEISLLPMASGTF